MEQKFIRTEYGRVNDELRWLQRCNTFTEPATCILSADGVMQLTRVHLLLNSMKKVLLM